MKKTPLHPETATEVGQILQPMFHANHARPRSRRELIGQGFLHGASALVAPSLLGFLGGRSADVVAQAADCGLNTLGQTMPVIMIDVQGGGALCGASVCVGRQEDQTDGAHFTENAWIKFGHPPETRYNASGNNVDRTLGIPFTKTSALLKGILSRATASTRAGVNGVVFGTESISDTDTNMINPCYALGLAGIGGSILPLTGTRDNRFGANSMGPYFDPSIMPAVVTNPGQARALLDISKIAQLMMNNPNNSEAALKAIDALSSKKISKLNESEVAKQILRCTYSQAPGIAVGGGGPDKLDPLLDTNLNTAFGGKHKEAGSFMERTATAAKLVMGGFAGAAVIELEGFDYHDLTRSKGDRYDYAAGECIGAVMEYASLLNQPVMIYVFTDGGIRSTGVVDESVGLYGWATDDSVTAGSLLLHYNPKGRVPFVNHQVGAFGSAGGSLLSPVTTRDHKALVDAVAANYLALNGRISEFSDRFAVTSLNTRNLQQYVGMGL